MSGLYFGDHFPQRNDQKKLVISLKKHHDFLQSFVIGGACCFVCGFGHGMVLWGVLVDNSQWFFDTD